MIVVFGRLKMTKKYCDIDNWTNALLKDEYDKIVKEYSLIRTILGQRIGFDDISELEKESEDIVRVEHNLGNLLEHET